MGHEDEPPPPTYEAALNDVQVDPNTPLAQQVQQPPVTDSIRPDHPPPPPRPSYNSYSPHMAPPPSRPPSSAPPPSRPPSSAPPPPSRPSSSRPPPSSAPDIYSNSDDLPWKYPKGYFCNKCKNTGFKVKNGKVCSDCWKKFLTKRIAYNPNPKLPFKFPPGFICNKCINTGYKKGKSCRDCWEDFGPRNSPSIVRPAAPTIFGSAGPGLRVLPGDPRIGGVLCSRCRGSGVNHFFLDTYPCDTCQGLGRIVSQAPTGMGPGPMGPMGHMGPGPMGGMGGQMGGPMGGHFGPRY